MPPIVACADVLTSTGKPQAVRLQTGIQLIEDDAGLHGGRHRVLVEGEDAVERLAVIDDQRGADGLPALRRSGAAWQHGDVQVAGDRERGLGIGFVARDDDAHR